MSRIDQSTVSYQSNARPNDLSESSIGQTSLVQSDQAAQPVETEEAGETVYFFSINSAVSNRPGRNDVKLTKEQITALIGSQPQQREDTPLIRPQQQESAAPATDEPSCCCPGFTKFKAAFFCALESLKPSTDTNLHNTLQNMH